MNISLKGKRAVVAGGSRGIGRSIALAFAAAGANVSICARGAEGLKAAAGDIGKTGVQVHWGACDLADGAAIARYVEDAARTAPLALRIFDSTLWRPDQPLRVVLIGTDWEVRVWDALMKIPMGQTTTYSDIARKVCTVKAARAVGGARSRRRLPSR